MTFFTVFNMKKGRDNDTLPLPFVGCVYTVVEAVSLGIPSFPNFACVKLLYEQH